MSQFHHKYGESLPHVGKEGSKNKNKYFNFTFSHMNVEFKHIPHPAAACVVAADTVLFFTVGSKH